MARYVMCPDCGHRMSRDYDMYGYWDGESYICNYCDSDDDDDDIPECCLACGNNYPECTFGCSLFDD